MRNIEETNVLLIGDEEDTNSNLIEKCLEGTMNDGKAYWYMVALALGNAADAVEILCVGYIMTELGDSITTHQKEFLSAAVFFGMLFGGLLCGLVSDRIGRKPCLIFSLVLNAIAGLSSAISPNMSMLIFTRVIGGIGIGGSVPTVFTLGAELFPSSHRGRLLSYIASFWMVGALFVALAAWIMLGTDLHGNRIVPGLTWRHFATVAAIPAVVAIFATHYIVPESPRFLIQKDRMNEAAQALSSITGTTIHANELRQKTRITSTYPNPSTSTNNPSQTFSQLTATLLHLFDSSLCKTTLIFMLIWYTLSFGSYGISSWITILFEDLHIGNIYFSAFLFALANLPGNMISILYIDQIGRHQLLQYGMIGAAICALIFGLGRNHTVIVVLFSCLFNAFSVAGWNSLDCMSAEEFPTDVRSSAMGLVAASGRIGAMTAQFVNGTLEKSIGSLLFVTFSCMFIGGISSRFLEQDTTGMALKDRK